MKMLMWLVVLLVPSMAVAQFSVSSKPTTPDNTQAVIDFPVSQGMHNTGGMGPRGPGTGYGLCVFTSIEHACRWANIKPLYGLQKYMTYQEGGGHPSKVDQVLKQFCKEKGVPVPPYVQHEGGDVEFLKLALKTDRMVCVTYCGADGVNYGDSTIAHMTNLLHLDDKWAIVYDNNYEKQYLIMPASDFACRWRGVQKDGRNYLIRTTRGWSPVGGGWAIVFLNPPPPSYPNSTATAIDVHPLPLFPDLGYRTERDIGSEELSNRLERMYGQCPGGICPAPANPTVVAPVAGFWAVHVNGVEWYYWQGGKCVAMAKADGSCVATDSNGNPTGQQVSLPAPLPFTPVAAVSTPNSEAPPPPSAVPVGEDYGVDVTKLRNSRAYSLSGRPCTKAEAEAALTGDLKDDTEKWHFTVVGTATFCSRVQKDLQVVGLYPDRLHVQCYDPLDWPVQQFSLPLGVSLRSPSAARISSQVAVISEADYSTDKLKEVLKYTDVDVTPTPKPTPNTPSPAPNTPAIPATPISLSDVILAALVAVLGWLALRKKK